MPAHSQTNGTCSTIGSMDRRIYVGSNPTTSPRNPNAYENRIVGLAAYSHKPVCSHILVRLPVLRTRPANRQARHFSLSQRTHNAAQAIKNLREVAEVKPPTTDQFYPLGSVGSRCRCQILPSRFSCFKRQDDNPELVSGANHVLAGIVIKLETRHRELMGRNLIHR